MWRIRTPNRRSLLTPKKSNPKKIVALIAALNAAVWLGARSFSLVAGPAFFSPALEPILPKPEDGIAARYLIGKFTAFQIACASISLGTMAIGWRWNARRFPVPQALVLGTVILLIVVSMVWIMPKLDAMHHAKYADYFGLNVTPEVQQTAAKQFGPLHGLSQVGNLLVLLGLLAQFILTWRLATEFNQKEN